MHDRTGHVFFALPFSSLQHSHFLHIFILLFAAICPAPSQFFHLWGICLYILDVCVAHRSTIRSVKCLASWQRCWSRRIRPWSAPSRPRCRRISGTSANAAWRPWRHSYRTMTLRSTLTNQTKSPSFLARIDFYQWKWDGMKPNQMPRKSNRHTQLLEFMVTTEQWRWQKDAPNIENAIER